MSGVFACDACGKPTPLHLLDAKPDDPEKPACCDWTRFECEGCYGPGWEEGVLDTPPPTTGADAAGAEEAGRG